MKSQQPSTFCLAGRRGQPLAIVPENQVNILHLSDILVKFRAELERQAGVPLEQIEVSASFVLNDLCAFLGFDQSLRNDIMGRDAALFVDSFLGQEVI